MIRIEFWNGHSHRLKHKYKKYDGHIPTRHNPCLWTNFSTESTPWRTVYPKALEYLDEYKSGKITSTELLHGLRYVAYGYSNDGNDKRDYMDTDVVWTGNLTPYHTPKIAVQTSGEEYTMHFYFKGDVTDAVTDNWEIKICDGATFYWNLE
jgi:hypothetical protein